MTSGYPCPNPACSHVFSADLVGGATALKCPVCGNVFRLRPSKVASRVAPPRPTTAPPTAMQVPAESSSILFAPPTNLMPMDVRQSKPKRRGGWTRALVWMVFFVLSAWLLVAFYSY